MITEGLVKILDDRLHLVSSAIAMKDSRDGDTRWLRARRDALPLRIATFVKDVACKILEGW
jgi:hypothetical protein